MLDKIIPTCRFVVDNVNHIKINYDKIKELIAIFNRAILVYSIFTIRSILINLLYIYYYYLSC